MSIKLLRISEVAQILDVTEARAYEMARQGLFPIVRLGRQIRVDEEALRRWIIDGGQALSGGWKRNGDLQESLTQRANR